jgi:nucleoid DNA-binding protein
MKELPTSIDKRILWRYINKKINNIIHNYHVFGVISILFDEIIKDLKAGKAIKIYNFGTLILKKTKPRRYHNVFSKEFSVSPGYKIIRFTLAPQIRKKLCKHIDIDKTFLGD